MGSIEDARKALNNKRNMLDQIPVEKQVKDIEHARSPEIIKYCVDYLINGGTWGELRRKLGLGPAHLDTRWRTIRNEVTKDMLPVNEEEALLVQGSMRNYLVSKLEAYIEEIEEKINSIDEDDAKVKVEHHYWKMKMEGLKLLLDENNKAFENYAEMRRVKSFDKRVQGVSIIVQNNYHIPRPGEDLTDVTESVKKVSSLLSMGEPDE